MQKPVPSASFEFHRQIPGYQSSFYLLGVVRNTSEIVIDRAKVIAVLVDGDGDEVGSVAGYALRDQLDPGDSSPVKILVRDPPAHTDLSFEVHSRAARFDRRARGLEVTANDPRQTSEKLWSVDGVVENRGEAAASFVKVSTSVLDGDGRLVGVFWTYTDARTIPRGGRSRFRHRRLVLHGAPARFEHRVDGKVAR